MNIIQLLNPFVHSLTIITSGKKAWLFKDYQEAMTFATSQGEEFSFAYRKIPSACPVTYSMGENFAERFMGDFESISNRIFDTENEKQLVKYC